MKDSSKVILDGYMLVPDEELNLIKAELANHITNTLLEPGCLVFKVTQDSENKNRFNVYEEFLNKVAFQAHQDRTKKSTWGQVSKNVERHFQVTNSDS